MQIYTSRYACNDFKYPPCGKENYFLWFIYGLSMVCRRLYFWCTLLFRINGILQIWNNMGGKKYSMWGKEYPFQEKYLKKIYEEKKKKKQLKKKILKKKNKKKKKKNIIIYRF